ncbi:GDP-mannose 4,6-dehydratase [uncultured archaeon]|nr:GDP-mannose 4,6-dehydratase [uncultured archaeon]
MEKVAVIGSNSFSGSHFVDYLLEKTDYGVIGISRSPEPNSIFLPYKERKSERFKFYQFDLNNNLGEITELLEKEKISYVVNYAAQGMVGQSWGNPVQWFKTNTLAIVALIDKLRRMPQIKKYVQVSTPEIYGSCKNVSEDAPYNPTSPYATSKLSADMFIQSIVKQFNFPAVFTRSANVYGPGQQLYRIIPISIIKIKKGEKIQLQGGGKAIRSFINIKDNCDGTLKVMERGEVGEVYHLSSEITYSIESIVRIICKKMNISFEDAVEITEERVGGQDKEYLINSKKIREKLNWNPRIRLDDGIDECIEWVNKNWEVIKTQPLEYIHKE